MYELGPNFNLIEESTYNWNESYGVLRHFKIDSKITPKLKKQAQNTLSEIVQLAIKSDPALKLDESTIPNNKEITVLKTPDNQIYTIGYDIRFYEKNNVTVITFSEFTNKQTLCETVKKIPTPEYFKDGQEFIAKKVLNKI